jgi:uncharacterized protein (DUF2141 family)
VLAAALFWAGTAAPASEPAANPPPGARLTIRVTGLRSSRGNVCIGLYKDARGFPNDPERALAQEVVPVGAGKSASVVMTGLTPGVYAVTLLHDENKNNKLDTGWFGIPKEGYGASNNPRVRFKPPRFDAARFPLDGGDKTIEIKVRY